MCFASHAWLQASWSSQWQMCGSSCRQRRLEVMERVDVQSALQGSGTTCCCLVVHHEIFRPGFVVARAPPQSTTRDAAAPPGGRSLPCSVPCAPDLTIGAMRSAASPAAHMYGPLAASCSEQRRLGNAGGGCLAAACAHGMFESANTRAQLGYVHLIRIHRAGWPADSTSRQQG